ncbi:MAG: hypothetical protein HY875_16990 [Chloroflexi bacterium]|nr:hypothetical protein [Chloroflexota bacterium]
MTGRGGAGPQLPWSRRQSGIYGGKGPRSYQRPLFYVLGALAAVALAYLLFTKACGGGGCSEEYCESSRKITPPDGFELVSKIYEHREDGATLPAGSDAQVYLPLTKATTDNRNLTFFRYVEESKAWEPVTAAVLEPQGNKVSGVFHDMPALIAILRRTGSQWTVAAYLEHNAPLHREATGKVTIVHPLDFRPQSDGTLQGELSTTKFDPGVAVYPVVYANATDRAAVPIVTGILSSPASRSAHVQQIVAKAAEKKLEGIDIAYLDLPATERTNFTLFIAELAQALHAQSKKLTLTLPPPQRAQDRIDEGAYDWAELGKAADVVQMTPYRDQGTYRKSMPDILTYLTGIVEPSKLVLTVTPYATVQAAEGIQRVPISTAMTIATKMSIGGSASQKIETNSILEIRGTNIDKTENLTGVQWDPNSATVAFTYKDNGGRTIWLENYFSVGFKLEFVSRFKLGGLAVEDGSDNIYLGNIWPAITPFVTGGQPVLLQPNPADLQPVWNAQKGQLEDTRKGVVKWTTPAEPGTYTITLTLSDGVSRFENEVAIVVQARAATPSPSPTATR